MIDLLNVSLRVLLHQIEYPPLLVFLSLSRSHLLEGKLHRLQLKTIKYICFMWIFQHILLHFISSLSQWNLLLHVWQKLLSMSSFEWEYVYVDTSLACLCLTILTLRFAYRRMKNPIAGGVTDICEVLIIGRCSSVEVDADLIAMDSYHTHL